MSFVLNTVGFVPSWACTFLASVLAMSILGALAQERRTPGGSASVLAVVLGLSVAAMAVVMRAGWDGLPGLLVGAGIPILASWLVLVALRRVRLLRRVAAACVAGLVATLATPLAALGFACWLGDCL